MFDFEAHFLICWLAKKPANQNACLKVKPKVNNFCFYVKVTAFLTASISLLGVIHKRRPQEWGGVQEEADTCGVRTWGEAGGGVKQKWFKTLWFKI